MANYPRAIEDLVAEFRKFPGIGEKNAQRFAFYLLRQSPENLQQLAKKISEIHTLVTKCGVCGFIDDSSPCRFDRDQSRDGQLLCVVAESTDVPPIERSGAFRGRYHVLGGTLNPLEGITPEHLNIASLIERVRRGRIREVIIATNPDLEGETTALHLKKTLSPLKVKVTRLGRGLPMGATLEYADEVTIANAIKGRQAP